MKQSIHEKELIAQYKSSIINGSKKKQKVVVQVSPYCYTKMRLHSIDAYKKRNPKGRRPETCWKVSSPYSSGLFEYPAL